MFTRIRIAFGFAVLASMFVAVSVSAKGGFAFINITGDSLNEPVRATNTELKRDFFAFADFSQSRIDEPAEPGMGYEITRYYIDNNREIVFDKLHYYPVAGFVYYDGIVNGSSEYDGKWYTPRAEIRSVFESVLPVVAMTAPLSGETVEQQQSSRPLRPAQPNRLLTSPPVLVLVIGAASLAVFLILFLSRRRRMA